MIRWGEPIPWDCAPVTLQDGSVVQPKFPWPDEVVFYITEGSSWHVAEAKKLSWGYCGRYTITQFRLRPDHHAYTKKRTMEGAEPDGWMNTYQQHQEYSYDYIKSLRKYADRAAHPDRIGIWLIYLK